MDIPSIIGGITHYTKWDAPASSLLTWNDMIYIKLLLDEIINQLITRVPPGMYWYMQYGVYM